MYVPIALAGTFTAFMPTPKVWDNDMVLTGRSTWKWEGGAWRALGWESIWRRSWSAKQVDGDWFTPEMRREPMIDPSTPYCYAMAYIYTTAGWKRVTCAVNYRVPNMLGDTTFPPFEIRC